MSFQHLIAYAYLAANAALFGRWGLYALQDAQLLANPSLRRLALAFLIWSALALSVAVILFKASKGHRE